MKKTFASILIAILLLCTFALPQAQLQAATTRTSSTPTIYIDGQEITLDVPPLIVNNRALVPLRGVFENLGATVDWNKATNQVIVKNKSMEVLLELNNTAVLVNGQINFLDTPTQLQGDRTLVPIRFIAETLGHKVTWNSKTYRIDITTQTTTPDIKSPLPTLGSAKAFTQLLHYNNVLNAYISGQNFPPTGTPIFSLDNKASESTTDTASGASSEKPTSDFSDTNNQTIGVDEGDTLKTNGKNIFSLNQNRIHIIDPSPTKPTILSTINIPDQRGNVSDLYIEGNRLVILGTSWSNYAYPAEFSASSSKGILPAYGTINTFVLIYDISNPAQPILTQDMDYEGSYISSRLIKDKLYVITNKNLNYWNIGPLYRSSSAEDLDDYSFRPKYTDNITGKMTVIPYDEIHYFPNYVTPNYMLTIGIDLATNLVDVKTYLGSAEIVYASADHLYLSFTNYNYEKTDNALLYVPNYTKSTTLYKFKLEAGQINYVANGSVPGSALNQFSLDAFEGNLRIATTTGEMWDTNNISKNNVYILNSELQEIGKLTDLAPGERIYSTRFAGSRIYMVTFKQVDPFFVIDAEDPTAPKLLGYLKIPGFSTYMHLLDENHVLGFGSDTVENEGRVTTGGFKISLFDVTDPANPIEKNKEIIGTSGTYSELQNNHKALMISLSKGIMAFPITVSGKTPYVTDFSGAYVYNISKDSFDFKGSLTHQDATTLTGDGYYDYNFNINRLVYIGDYLYSLSGGKMVVTSLIDMKKTSEVTFPTKIYDDTVYSIDAVETPLFVK